MWALMGLLPESAVVEDVVGLMALSCQRYVGGWVDTLVSGEPSTVNQACARRASVL